MNSPNDTSSDSEIETIKFVQEVIINKKKKKNKDNDMPKIAFSSTASNHIDNLKSTKKKNIKFRSEKKSISTNLNNKTSTKNRGNNEKKKKENSWVTEEETNVNVGTGYMQYPNVSNKKKEKTAKHTDEDQKKVLVKYVEAANINVLDTSKHKKKRRTDGVFKEKDKPASKLILDQTDLFYKTKEINKALVNSVGQRINQIVNFHSDTEQNDGLERQIDDDRTNNLKQFEKHNKKPAKRNDNGHSNLTLNQNKHQKSKINELNNVKLFDSLEVVNSQTELKGDRLYDINKSIKKNKHKRVFATNLSRENVERRENSFQNDLQINKKRKRDMITDKSHTEEILFKSKKLKSSTESILQECITEASTRSESRYPEKIMEIKERLDEYHLVNKSFEDRLSVTVGCFEKNVSVNNNKSKDVFISDRDPSFDGIIDKLIKSRKKTFDKENFGIKRENKQQPVERVQKISKEIEESFKNRRKKSNNHCQYVGDETNNIENKVDRMHKKKGCKSTNKKENAQSDKHTINTLSDAQRNLSRSHKKSRMNDLSMNEENSTISNNSDYVNGIKLSTLQLKALKGLIVKLPFQPHPIHMIETKLTNRPKPEQRRQMESLGYKLSLKCYNKWEDHLIRNNWKEFCERHILDEDPGPFLVPNIHFPHQERCKFARYLARGLESRTLASVYKRYRLLFSTHLRKGKFTKEEDRIIFETINKVELEGYSKKQVKVFAQLASILKRDRLQIEKHYISISQKRKSRLIITDCDGLIKALLQVLGKENVEDLKDCEITLTDWKAMEKRLDYPYNYIKSFWRNTVYPKLFYNGDLDIFNIRKYITHTLHKDEACDWKLVNWEKISEEFTGQTGPSMYRLFKNLVRTQVPKPMRGSLQDCTTHLIDNYFNLNPKTRMFPDGVFKRIIQDKEGFYKIDNDD